MVTNNNKCTSADYRLCRRFKNSTCSGAEEPNSEDLKRDVVQSPTYQSGKYNVEYHDIYK